MKGSLYLTAALVCSLTASAQDVAVISEPGSNEPHTVAPAAAPELPAAEQRVRAGIILLNSLHETMSGIRDRDSAEAAVAPLMRLRSALQEWAASFTSLPPLSEQEQQAYEEQYIPIFKKLNGRIRSQGERIAAAEYYGSRDLPAALMHLALLNQ